MTAPAAAAPTPEPVDPVDELFRSIVGDYEPPARRRRRRRPVSLTRQVTRGLRWSFANSLLTRFGQIAVGVVMARVLAPTDFGVFAVALVAFQILINISELGVSVALVRRPDPERIAPTVMTLTIISGLTFGALSFLGAPLLAGTLGAPAASGVLQVLSLALVLAGISAVPSALLQRGFRADLRMVADTLNFVVATGVGIWLALAGFGAWSLAWSRVAGNAVSAVLLFAMAPWIPKPGFDREQARELLRFGLPLAASSLLVFAVLNVDSMVIGRLLGATELGIYVLAFNLSSWPVTAFSQAARGVSLAGFSRLIGDPAAMSAGFGRSMRLLMALALPVCVMLAALGPPLVHLVYGDQWVRATEALAALAALGALRVALELTYDLLVAAGRAKAVFRLQMLWLVALAPALLLGARLDGIRGVALAHLAVAALVVVPVHLVALRRAGVAIGALGAQLVRPALGAAAAGLVALLARYLDAPDVVVLLVGGGLAGLVYLLAVLPMRNELRTILPGPSVQGV